MSNKDNKGQQRPQDKSWYNVSFDPPKEPHRQSKNQNRGGKPADNGSKTPSPANHRTIHNRKPYNPFKSNPRSSHTYQSNLEKLSRHQVQPLAKGGPKNPETSPGLDPLKKNKQKTRSPQPPSSNHKDFSQVKQEAKISRNPTGLNRNKGPQEPGTGLTSPGSPSPIQPPACKHNNQEQNTGSPDLALTSLERRRQRIRELEGLHSDEEIKASYRGYFRMDENRDPRPPTHPEGSPSLDQLHASKPGPKPVDRQKQARPASSAEKQSKEIDATRVYSAPLRDARKTPSRQAGPSNQQACPPQSDPPQLQPDLVERSSKTAHPVPLPDPDQVLDQDSQEPIILSRLEDGHQPDPLPPPSFKDKVVMGINICLDVLGGLASSLLALGLLGGALVAGMGLGYFAHLVSQTDPPSYEAMATQLNQYDQQSTMYYASGEPIAEIRSDVVRTLANLDNVSDYIIDGFISTEDEYFYDHPGIVPKAIIRAALQTLLTGSGTGGSTITQQLVKQQLLSNDVTFFRKANEILLALRVENYFDKDEILTAYLNVSPFGRNNHGENVAGIYQAAEGIFGVDPSAVNLNQAAFLVGLPQDPYTYTPYDQSGQLRENLKPGIQRMQEVLYRMYRNQVIDKASYEAAMQYDITQDFLPADPIEEKRQSYLYQAIMHGSIEILMQKNLEADGYDWKTVWSDVDLYNQYYFEAEEEVRTGGYHIYSTIDQEIYDQLQVSSQAYNDELGVTYDGVYVDPETGEEIYYVEPVQTGLVVIDNPTGRVLGFVSGTDYENNQIDHAFQMRRSPGSTIKPMAVYGPAIEHNLISPATLIPDTAFVQTFEDGSTWAPTNYGNYVSGDILSVRTALLRSDNLPVVRIYEELLRQGIPIIDYLEQMGFNTVDAYTEEDTYNLAFSLGGVTTGPTVFEETSGFTTFANNGHYVAGYYIDRIEDAQGDIIHQHDQAPVQVFSEDTNYLMVDMLRDTMTQGTGRTANEYLNVPGDWIAKTGISENSKDIWVLASTPQITIGSWIGYDSRFGDYTIDVNDGYGLESVRSQIYWARIVNDLYALRPEIFGSDQVFIQPPSVIQQNVVAQTGTLPGSIQINGRMVQVSQPLKTELFKLEAPAPELRYDFLFGASQDEQTRAWQTIIGRQEEERQQREAESRENEESSGDGDNSDGPQDETHSENPEPGQDPNNPAGQQGSPENQPPPSQ